MDNLDNHSISELLLLSKQSKHLLHAYKEIRQEVSFLATLNRSLASSLILVECDPMQSSVVNTMKLRKPQNIRNKSGP